MLWVLIRIASQKLSFNYHQISSNTHLISSSALCFRYAAVVKACALEEDFSDFVTGDQTEVTCAPHSNMLCLIDANVV